MKRIAILGANGQVGTELCLRLRDVDGIEVVPITRNVSGSAFLRLQGIECRHGRITNPAEARELIGDCDVIANFALSNTAIPRIDRDVNRQITRSVVAAAKPGVPIVFASTIMVYAPAMKFRIPDSYGLEKLLTEKMFRRLCRASRHPAFVFRLGHVMGELQNITSKIRSEIRSGRVALPHDGGRASNTVFVTAIAEAIVQVARATPKPGTYDLITFPQWTWLDVYQYYAKRTWTADALGASRSGSYSEIRIEQRARCDATFFSLPHRSSFGPGAAHISPGVLASPRQSANVFAIFADAGADRDQRLATVRSSGILRTGLARVEGAPFWPNA